MSQKERVSLELGQPAMLEEGEVKISRNLGDIINE